jgi:hypothetical protein
MRFLKYFVGNIKFGLIVIMLWMQFTIDVHSQELGANYNENIDQINNDMILDSGVRWIRGFVHIPRYFLNVSTSGVVTGVNLSAIRNFDPIDKFIGVKELEVGGEPIKTILSFKLDFKFRDMGVPEDGSAAMYYFMTAIETFLKEKDLGAKIDILVVGNEPMWETEQADVDKLEVLTNKLIDLVYAMREERAGWDYKIYTGALNRVNELRNNVILQRIIKITKENDKVDGIDLHPHVRDLNVIRQDLLYIRTQAGISKDIICTEVSAVRLWDDRMNDALGEWGVQNGYPATMKMYEWINELLKKSIEGAPVSQEHFMSYFNAQSWYPKTWLLDAYDMLVQNNVKVATYGFQRELRDPPIYLNENSAMWVLNFVYNGALFGVGEGGLWKTNPLVYPQFREIIDRIYTSVPDTPIETGDANSKFIYPNPTGHRLFIGGNKPDPGMNYSIYSVNGIKLRKGTYLGEGIEVSDLSSGLYFLSFEGGFSKPVMFFKL